MSPPLLRGMVNIQEGVSRWFQNNIGVKSFWGVMLSELGLVHFSEPLDNDEIETAQSLVRMFDEIYTPCLESNSLLKLVSVLKAVTDTLGETARCALKVKRLMIHNISVILLLMKLLMVKKRTFSKPNFIQKLVVASQALIDKCMLMVLSKNESDEEVISRFQEALSSQANTHLNDVLPWNESEQQGKEYFMEFCIYLFITKLLINQKSYSPKKLDYLDLGTPINVKQRPSVTRNLAYSHLNRNRRNLCRARSL